MRIIQAPYPPEDFAFHEFLSETIPQKNRVAAKASRLSEDHPSPTVAKRQLDGIRQVLQGEEALGGGTKAFQAESYGLYVVRYFCLSHYNKQKTLEKWSETRVSTERRE